MQVDYGESFGRDLWYVGGRLVVRGKRLDGGKRGRECGWEGGKVGVNS